MKPSNTEVEITAQPRLWLETYFIIESQHAKLTKFLNTCFTSKNLDIIITGAGSSAYIGEVLSKHFQRNVQRDTKAIPTTDLILHPADYFKENSTTLMISFARSGDSPESLAAMNIAENLCENLFHLIITCNPEGQLALNANDKNSYVLFMPREANDKGLAMTGSFTTMLLAGLLVSDLNNLKTNKIYVEALATYGNIILTKFKQKIMSLAKHSFNRIVFVGSGPLKAIARESQLKVTELTNGQVIGKYDSFLGLRHGPKAVIDDHTVVIYLFSNDDFVNQYEYDLVRSINSQKEKMVEIGVSEVFKNKSKIKLDLSIEVSETNTIPEEYFAICAVLPSQLLGLYKSINLGLSPDSPSLNKSINRVVQGVKIYHK